MNIEEILLEDVKYTSKTQNMREGAVKKCSYFRMCFNLNEYSLKQMNIVTDESIYELHNNHKSKPTTDIQKIQRGTQAFH